MKKLLIIGAGIEQIPAIKIAKEMGFYIITSDYNPKAPGIQFADEFHEVSTHDKEGNLAIASKIGIDGVLTICSETAVPVVGFLCEQLGLPGLSLDTAIKSTNKGAMRQAMEEFDVAMPPRKFIATYEDAIQFTTDYVGPWVLKPSDSSGQRGTNLITDKTELKAAFDEAKHFSTDDMVLIDQFVEGPEINVNAVVKNGDVTILSLANRITLDDPYFGIAVCHLAPTNVSTAQEEQVKELAKNAVKAIGLTDGIAYPQIIVTKEGPKLIEIAARMPGGYNREMARNLSGIDLVKAQILIALGESFTIEGLKEHETYSSSGVKLLTSVDFPELVGKKVVGVKGIENVLAQKGVQEFNFHLKVGEIIPALENSVGRFAATIAVGGSKEEVLTILEKSKNLIEIETD